MKKTLFGHTVTAAAFCSLLLGCDSALLRGDVTVWGTKPLIDSEKFERIDLSREILAATPAVYQPNMELDGSLRIFYSTLGSDDQMFGRDRIQERILAASKQRCGEYRNFLKEFDAQSNFILGSLTTGLAGAGAIFTNVDVVRALSGSASIVSGVRAELNEDYFHTLTIQVITDGFGARRAELYEAIQERQRQNIREYTLEAAIKDAVEYHENCSLLAGLEKAAKSIERARNPGLDAMVEAARKVQLIRASLRDALDDDAIRVRPPAEDETGGAEDTTSGVSASPVQAARTPGDALVTFIMTEKARDLLSAETDELEKFAAGDRPLVTERSLFKYDPSKSSSDYDEDSEKTEDDKVCPDLPSPIVEDEKAIEASIYTSQVLLVQRCESIVQDRELAKAAIAPRNGDRNGKPKIVVENEMLLEDANSIIKSDERTALATLEAERIPLLALVKTAEPGPALVSATAKLNLHEAGINSKITLYQSMSERLDARLAESRKVFDILANLDQRILEYNEAVKELSDREKARSK